MEGTFFLTVHAFKIKSTKRVKYLHIRPWEVVFECSLMMSMINATRMKKSLDGDLGMITRRK